MYRVAGVCARMGSHDTALALLHLAVAHEWTQTEAPYAKPWDRLREMSNRMSKEAMMIGRTASLPSPRRTSPASSPDGGAALTHPMRLLDAMMRIDGIKPLHAPTLVLLLQPEKGEWHHSEAASPSSNAVAEELPVPSNLLQARLSSLALPTCLFLLASEN